MRKLVAILASNTVFGFTKKKLFDSVKKKKKKYYYMNIRNFWEQNQPKTSSTNKILVDLMFEHPLMNTNCLLTGKLSQLNFGGDLIGLHDYDVSQSLRNYASAYGVYKHVSVFSFSSVKNYILAYKAYKSNYIKYDKHKAISIQVDEQEIGDLIYDQYMRIYSIPTVRMVKLSYKVFVFKSLYLYYCYKALLVSEQITDIVLSHNVYAKYGLLARAGASLDRKLTLWQWYGTHRLSISRSECMSSFIRMPRKFEAEHLELLRSKLESEQIENDYQALMRARQQAKDTNQIDLSYVYNDVDIENLSSFSKVYSYNKSKRTYFIYSHAFVDAVKYTDWQVFSDYYTWLEETLKTMALVSHSANVYVKPHPSESLYPCKESVLSVVQRINDEYDANFIYLDRKVSNLLTFEVADLFITASGSIALECTCYGKPCLLAASSLFENQSGVLQARSEEQYISMLNRIESIRYLTESDILSAKIQFIWYSKYVVNNTSLTVPMEFRIGADFEQETEKLDKGYINIDLSSDQLVQSVQFLAEHDGIEAHNLWSIK